MTGNPNKHPETLEEDVLTKGVIEAIAYAINHPGVVAEVGSDEYNHLMDMFQDWIPPELIDHSQWWIGHYWSSGHKCIECQEMVRLFRCDGLTLDQRLKEAASHNPLLLVPGCNGRNKSSFDGVKICLSLNDL
jgi:hypothetical protein